jgi:hypothetical protein
MYRESIGETGNSKYGSCSETERMETTYENPSVNGNIILKRILRKREEKV